ERPEHLEAVKDILLANIDNPVVVTGKTIRLGVHGMGGIGKSVLAAVVARDDDVRRAFPDGVLWVTIGQNPPSIPPRQRQVALALDDEPDPFEDVQQGKAYLSKLLADKACLIILDDVWEARHAEAFDALGPRCRMLVTTRDGGLVDALDAEEYRLDVLTDDAALRLIAKWSKADVDSLPPEAAKVVKACGNLPLALSLCGAMVRDDTPWTDLLDALETADLAFIEERLPNYEHRDMLRSLKVSVDALSLESPERAERYCQLAAFPADENIPEAAVVTLWRHAGTPVRSARRLLTLLDQKAMLRLHVTRSEKLISLHDLQHDYLRAVADDLTGCHEALRDAYRKECTDGWHTGPDDGYFFQRLPYHLAQAGRWEELRDVLMDFPWLEAKLRVTDDANALIDDYDYANVGADPRVRPHNGNVVGADPRVRPDETMDEDLRLLQAAVRLSAHILAQDKGQLASQLVGRLVSCESAGIKEMLEEIGQCKTTPWLRPTAPGLTQAGGSLLRTLSGHEGGINSVAVTPDGKFAISGSSDNTLKVWDLDTGAEVRTLQGHTDWVMSVTVTPDGKFAISGSSDKTLKVWDLDTGAEVRTLQGHTNTVWSVTVTPDGKFAISGSSDKTLKVWDLDTGAEVRTLQGHTNTVWSVTVTPDGKFAISGSSDKTLKVWDLDTGAEVRTLQGHTDWVMSVTVTPDGKFAISGSSDKTLKVWDLDTGAEVRTLQGHTDWVMSVTVTPDGKFAISGSSDNTLKVWDLKTGEEVASFACEGALYACAVAPDGRTIVTGGASGQVHFLRLENA
ncbi:NB-ARC domain-containing protein, partial [Candidatus Poribacteria bacterium]